MNPAKRNQLVLCLIAIACFVHVLVFRGKVNMDIPIVKRILFAILALAVTLPVHELIHFLLMNLFGAKDVKIEVAKDPLGFPSLRTIGRGELPAWKRIIVLLAPFFILTLVPDVLFLSMEKVEIFFFIVAMGNSAGCCFDIADVIGILISQR